jgi:glycosyltransferase involved in cell wall biosynthesis
VTRDLPGVLMAISHFAPTIGGTEGQARALAAGLVRLGHRVTVLTQARPDAPPVEVVDGIAVERRLTGRGRGAVFGLTYVASLLRHLRRLAPGHEVLHAHHLYLEALAAAWIGRRLGLAAIAKPACAGADGDLARLRRTRVACALPLLRGLDRVVAISRQVREELLADRFDPARIVEIPNGVDTRRFAPPPDATQAAAELPAAPETVVFLGRLEAQKGTEAMLSAWARVLSRRPSAELLIAGDGPLRDSLERRVRDLGIGDRVRFLGVCGAPDRLLQASRAFLLPSRAEGLSNALLEAMATGLPCVASRIGGNTDLIEDGRTGLLVPPEDVEALADALLAILQDPERGRRLGRAARAAVVERFGMEAVLQRYAALYRSLAGRNAE